jgi:hypothetical protein
MKWARLLYLLADSAALSVGAVQAKVDRRRFDRLVHAQSLPQALSLSTWQRSLRRPPGTSSAG